MNFELLPADFDKRVAEAVKTFWATRQRPSGNRRQGGNRDAVTSGQNMNGFIELVRSVAVYCGFSADCAHTGWGDVVLPGYFRATKKWDVLVIHRGRLLAAFEFKSQVGSLGNNFNNRSEEVVGAAADLWAAHKEGAYQSGDQRTRSPEKVSTPGPHLLNPEIQDDPRPPFLAWLMLLEDSPDARRPVRVAEPHYKVFPEFRGASYAARYRLLCERLMSRRLYGAAALVLSEEATGLASGHFSSLTPATGVRSLFAAFAAKLFTASAEAQVDGPREDR